MTRAPAQGRVLQSCPSTCAEPARDERKKDTRYGIVALIQQTLSKASTYNHFASYGSKSLCFAQASLLVKGTCDISQLPSNEKVGVGQKETSDTYHFALPSMSHMPGRGALTFPTVAIVTPSKHAQRSRTAKWEHASSLKSTLLVKTAVCYCISQSRNVKVNRDKFAHLYIISFSS